MPRWAQFAVALAVLMAAGCSGDEPPAEKDSRKAHGADGPGRSSDGKSDEKAKEDPSRYRDREAGYSIKLPEGWKREGTAFMSPDLGDADPFIENARILTSAGEEGGASKFLERLIPQFRQEIPTFKEAERRQMEIGGQPAVALTYTYSDAGLNGTAIMYVASEEDRKAAMIFTALDSTIQEWKGRFDEAAQSFRFE